MYDDLVSAAAERSAQHTVAEDGDYIQDGLLHCGKCHTPKQGEYKTPWGVIRPFFPCRCEKERRERERLEEESILFEQRVQDMRREAFPDDAMAGWRFEVDDRANRKVSYAARQYAENFAQMRKGGKGLLFFGDVGTGKTFYAACIVNALVDKGYPCYLTDFARLERVFGGDFEGRQEYMDSLNRYSLLVLDDLGAERDTPYMTEIVHSVVDARYRAGLPLIVTTNIPAAELKSREQATGKKRIYSRLMEMCIPVEVTGSDRRREKLKDDFKAYKDMLGL